MEPSTQQDTGLPTAPSRHAYTAIMIQNTTLLHLADLLSGKGTMWSMGASIQATGAVPAITRDIPAEEKIMII